MQLFFYEIFYLFDTGCSTARCDFNSHSIGYHMLKMLYQKII